MLSWCPAVTPEKPGASRSLRPFRGTRQGVCGWLLERKRPCFCRLVRCGSKRGWGCGDLPTLSLRAATPTHNALSPSGHRVPWGSAGVGCGRPGRAGRPPYPHRGSLERPRGRARVPGAGPQAPDLLPLRSAAPSPRDTQEPITGPRGRAAAPWVRRAAGRSCLLGLGAHARRWRSGSADERRRGRGSSRLSRRSRRVVPANAAAPGSTRAAASRAAPAPARRGQHGGRGGPGERSPGAPSPERGAREAAPPPARPPPADLLQQPGRGVAAG